MVKLVYRTSLQFISAITLITIGFSNCYAETSDIKEQTSSSANKATNALFNFDPLHQRVIWEVDRRETDLWQRIRNGYAIPYLSLENPQVAQQLAWYSTRTDYILRAIERGERYLFHVVDELEKRGMPTELALLPFIESAFNPQAVSSAKATGMWQFMAATGRDYNLKQSMFKDDRRGIIDSTQAALNYLERLYGMFGDWQLALAAYNWGEGSVLKAIKKQEAAGLPTDYQSLSALMPIETRNYVPKLQAVKSIVEHPEQFNLKLPTLENQPYFVTINKTRDMDVRVAAQLAEISLQDFLALNPQFNRPIITGDSTTKILLPTENAPKFLDNLNAWQGPLASWSAVTVQKTERVENIAKKLGLNPNVLREVNFIPSRMLIKAGSTILIPKKSVSEDDDIAPKMVESAQLMIEKENIRTLSYKAQKRDTLQSVAKRFNVSTQDIVAWNSLKRENLNPGQTLKIQVSARPNTRGKQTIQSKSNSKLATKPAKPSVHGTKVATQGNKTLNKKN